MPASIGSMYEFSEKIHTKPSVQDLKYVKHSKMLAVSIVDAIITIMGMAIPLTQQAPIKQSKPFLYQFRGVRTASVSPSTSANNQNLLTLNNPYYSHQESWLLTRCLHSQQPPLPQSSCLCHPQPQSEEQQTGKPALGKPSGVSSLPRTHLDLR